MKDFAAETGAQPPPDAQPRRRCMMFGGDVVPFQFPHRRYQTVVVAMDE